jgi:hypothetical protein
MSKPGTPCHEPGADFYARDGISNGGLDRRSSELRGAEANQVVYAEVRPAPSWDFRPGRLGSGEARRLGVIGRR